MTRMIIPLLALLICAVALAPSASADVPYMNTLPHGDDQDVIEKSPGVPVGTGSAAESYGVFRGGTWYIKDDADPRGFTATEFGVGTDTPVVVGGEIGVFRGGTWYIKDDADPRGFTATEFGVGTDIPVVVDGRIGVFRGGTWYIRDDADPRGFTVEVFGVGTDIPVVVDGRIGVFRGGTWYIRDETDPRGFTVAVFGVGTDTPVVLDGEIGVFRGGTWYIRDGTDPRGFRDFIFGTTGDVPVVVPAETPYEVTVIRVDLIHTIGVVVEIEPLDEPLADATVEVADPDGVIHPVQPQYISAGLTLEEFWFVTPLDEVMVGTWRVNGVPYQKETDDFAGGSGTADDPYLVETAEHLDNVRYYLDKHFLQVADIDLSGYAAGEGWVPIASEDSMSYFTGSYDGDYYDITNLVINRPDENEVGLFAKTAGGAEFKNIWLRDVDITGNSYVGGLIGSMTRGEIYDCAVYGTVHGHNSHVGGLVGRSVHGIISYGWASGTVTCDRNNVGGLVGWNDGGRITDSGSEGRVEGDSRVGGLVGFHSYLFTMSPGTWNLIEESDSWATVEGRYQVGGLLGYMYMSAAVENCHAYGDVTGNTRVGGLTGNIHHGTITRSSAEGNVTGDRKIGGLLGYNFGQVTESNAQGIVRGDDEITGGLVGTNYGKVNDSYATGDTYGINMTGGLVGKSGGQLIIGSIVYPPYIGYVTNSYATGEVSGLENVGGLVGINLFESEVIHSYYDTETTKMTDTGKGEPKTTSQMQQQATYTDWDFSTIWSIQEGIAYPALRWEN